MGKIVDDIVKVILSAPSRSIADLYVDILVVITLTFSAEQKQPWFTQAYQKIPDDVLTEEEKILHIQKVLQPASKDTLYDYFDIVSKRSRNSYNRGS